MQNIRELSKNCNCVTATHLTLKVLYGKLRFKIHSTFWLFSKSCMTFYMHRDDTTSEKRPVAASKPYSMADETLPGGPLPTQASSEDSMKSHPSDNLLNRYLGMNFGDYLGQPTLPTFCRYTTHSGLVKSPESPADRPESAGHGLPRHFTASVTRGAVRFPHTRQHSQL